MAGLSPKDFELRDDDQVQHLDSVEQRTPQPRRLAVLLDEFHVSETAAVRMREVLTMYVDHELRPDDLLVVFKPLDSLPSIRLTNDRAESSARRSPRSKDAQEPTSPGQRSRSRPSVDRR